MSPGSRHAGRPQITPPFGYPSGKTWLTYFRFFSAHGAHRTRAKSKFLEDRVLRNVVRNPPGDPGSAGACHDDPARLAVRDVALEFAAAAVFLVEGFQVA